MSQAHPFFSIVIPTYNRPERLAVCLRSISALDYPGDRFEVIVVDDGSQMSIEPAVAAVQQSLNLILIQQANAGPAKARNAGAARARGEFLVFTDDDCTPLPDWLTRLAAQFAVTPDCAIGGRTLNALPDNLCSTASQILIDYLYEYYNTDTQLSSFFASNNLALPTSSFHALGGFDTAFPLAAGEDREFCDRWLHRGYQMVYAPDVQIRHAHHLKLKSFWRQHFNYGRGAFCFHQARAQRDQAPMKVEPLTFYFKLLTYPLRQFSVPRAVLLAALLFLSQVANVAGFFWQRSNQPPAKLNWA
jgi:GT2 family glycosyltransferase